LTAPRFHAIVQRNVMSNENENKSPLLKVVELLEQNGYYVVKAEEIPIENKPRGTIDIQVYPK